MTVMWIALLGCGGEEEERLGGLADACLERESDLGRELSSCREELTASRAALSGAGARGTTDAAPLLPMRARVRANPRETSELSFDAKSYTTRTVHSFRFRARLFNAFDELITCDSSEHEGAATCPAGAEEYRDQADTTVEPNRSARVQRPLPDFERVTKAIVTIYEVTFESGEQWHGAAVGYPAPPIRRAEDGEQDRDEGAGGLLERARGLEPAVEVE